MGGLLDDLALLGGTATTRVLSGASWAARLLTIMTDYTNGTALPGPVTNFPTAVTGWQGSQAIWQPIKSVCNNTLIQMANADTPLASVNLTYAMALLISQMRSSADSVKASVPSAGAFAAVGSPTGTPQIVTSLKNPKGYTLEYIFPETLTFACSSDSQGSATAGNEGVSVSGQAKASSIFAYGWPAGSGVKTTLRAVDGSKSNSAGNVLQNSDFFTTTTANLPDNWTARVGVVGTDIFTDTANSYTTGGGSLKFLGTGSALLDAVTQDFSTTPATGVGAGGTSYAILPNTVYHVNGWVKCSATPAAGVLEIALTDGSAYPSVVQNNDQSVACSFTKSLTAVSTTYVPFNGSFQTPAVLPTTTPPLRLRVRLSTAIDSGKAAFIGRLSMTPASQLYGPQGPFVSIHSGKVAMIDGISPDSWTVAMTNTWGVFQREFLRLFGMTNLNLPGQSIGMILPSSNSPTIPDSLVA
jgi:hypothetical protein